MSVFLIITCLGLFGLLAMALPGLTRHGGQHAKAGKLSGHAGSGHAGAGHALPGHAASAHGVGHAALTGLKGTKGLHGAPSAGQAVGGMASAAGSLRGGHAGHATGAQQPAQGAFFSMEHLIPEPRAIFSVITLLGAFGGVFNEWLPFWLAAVAAIPAAVLLEWALVGRLYKLAMGFQGRPATPLAALVLEEAQAVTRFRNGKGLVRVVRDGRAVQFSASLAPGQLDIPVRVGDKVRIEDVDSEKERVVVTLL